MTGRGDLVLAFAMAIAFHAGAFALGLPRTGGGGAGDGGAGRISVAVASPTVSAMVRRWDAPPEVSEPATLEVPGVPIEPQVALAEDVTPPRMALPDLSKEVATATVPQAPAISAPSRPVAPAIATDMPVLASVEAAPERLPVPEVPSPTHRHQEPDPQTAPPTAGMAPQPTERPRARPAETDAPAVARQVASGVGDAGLRGSARSMPAPDLSGAERQSAASAWAADIQQRIARYQAYPRGSRDEGRVRVAMVILPGGQLSGVSVAQSSGSASLDQAAIAAVRRAAPFPPAPAALNDAFFNVGQWISFERR